MEIKSLPYSYDAPALITQNPRHIAAAQGNHNLWDESVSRDRTAEPSRAAHVLGRVATPDIMGAEPLQYDDGNSLIPRSPKPGEIGYTNRQAYPALLGRAAELPSVES